MKVKKMERYGGKKTEKGIKGGDYFRVNRHRIYTHLKGKRYIVVPIEIFSEGLMD